MSFIAALLARPIVQRFISAAEIGIDTLIITNPQETSFGVHIDATITNTGPFDAKVTFGRGLVISWKSQALGTLRMDNINVDVAAGVGGRIKAQTTFDVTDLNLYTDFNKMLMNEELFPLEISGKHLTVRALGFRFRGITLPTKVATVKGFNGLRNCITNNSFDLPADDPAGGIQLTIQCTLKNPSQIGIEWSSVAFNVYASGIEIAPVSSSSSVTLAPQSITSIPLTGRLIPQNTAEGLAAVSAILNNFVQGKDSLVTFHGASVGLGDVTWLNEGIRTLRIVTSLPNRGKFNIIQSMALEQMEFVFTEATAYNPVSSSNATTITFSSPFAFPIDVTSLSQNVAVGFNGQSFAELVIPEAPSRTDVQHRIICLTFSDVFFAVFADQHSAFDKFVAATTLGSVQALALSGVINMTASTAVGVLSLSDIKFSVNSSIAGLQGLVAKPAIVANLDVNHGHSDHLLITVDTTLYNPSNLTISTGDISFVLQFEEESTGSAVLRNMVIRPDSVNYSTDVRYPPQGSSQTAAGQTMLENYLKGIDTDMVILGTSSTPIESLQLALSQIKRSSVTIPALQQNLIDTATLEFPTNIMQTAVAFTSFTLTNPFTASINLLKVTAKVTFQDFVVGEIKNVDLSSNPIHASGHSSITLPALPFDFNLNPLTIIWLITISAQEHNVDLGPLPQLFQLVIDNPNFHPPINTSVDVSAPAWVSGNQFDFNDAIMNALKGLQVDLAIVSLVKLDDYATSLSFSQKGVTAITDHTALYLIGAIIAPAVQDLVNGAILAFSEANITNISNNGFGLSLRGSLTNIGPLDALIEFVDPVTVQWQGNNIATISLPPIHAAANTGVPNYATFGTLVITDQTQFTSFSTYLFHNPSFDWTISTPTLRVTALGTIFDNVSMTKTITLKAFDNLPGVTIDNFLLSDYLAGGITISTACPALVQT